MKYLKCLKCGASIPIDDEKSVIEFCTYCGSKLNIQPKENNLAIPDSVILDYYVNAIESEIYHNRALAEQNYNKILEYRPDFAPAKRGLARLNVTEGIPDELSTMDTNENMKVLFSSVKPYILTVEFESEEDDRIELALRPGDERSVQLKPIPHMVMFRIGRKAYRRYIEFENPSTHLTIEYVFDGMNHIKIFNEEGDDLSEFFSELTI